MLKRITQNQLILGEGPMWDAENKLLYYVDIESRKVGRYNPRTGEQVFWETQERVGCIVPDKNLISAERNMLVRINPENGKREIIAHFPIEERLRFNDGKCDCMGRLWIGTMAIEQGTPYAKGCGSLYCYDGEMLVKVLEGLTISNGIAFSNDDSIMYHIDTPTKQICSYHFDKKTGRLSDKQVVVRVEREGSPDGMTIDCDGMLWVALWGGFGVAKYNPKTGQEVGFVAVPDKYVSCCIFGGENMDLLYITSAEDEEGKGGYVYEWGTGVKGKAPYPFYKKSIEKEGNLG